MIPAESWPVSISRVLNWWMQGFGSTCSASMCDRATIPEEVELINSMTPESDVDVKPFHSIRLLSYNIFIRPPAPKFTHNVTDDFKDQRLRCFIDSHLMNYDVICLQEMFGAFSRRRKKLIRAARKQGFLWKASSPQSRSSMYLVDGGCLILSKVKIAAHASTIFQPGIMSDRLAAKGAVYAKLNPKPGVYIHLFVTHLQAVYAGSDSVKECLAVQKRQYGELVEFVASTVASNETNSDMLIAQGLIDKRRFRLPPGQDKSMSLPATRKCRRWPILITGDFNCNSRPPPGDIVTKTTPQYSDLCKELSKLGDFSDVLYEKLGDHPVTYAAADFSLRGQFSPRETLLTHPDDYHESGEYVNQSLDYIFHFPPSYEDVAAQVTSPKSSTVRTAELTVDHLAYIKNVHDPSASDELKCLSDHLAVQAVFDIGGDSGH